MIFLNTCSTTLSLIYNKNIFLINNLYTDKTWLVYSNLISLFLITIFILLLGMLFLNKAKHVKFLNLTSAFYLIIFFYLNSLKYNYDFLNLNLTFNQNTSLFVNLFIFIATITTIIYFLSISDVFFLEENMKVEFSFLIWFIYLAAIFLVSSTDFISIIILLECIAFSSYILVGFERKNKFSTTSALKYLILASIPGGCFILGLSLLYHNYGSFSQDYLLLLLQTIDTQNWYHSVLTDQNVVEILFILTQYYSYSFTEIFTSFFAQSTFFINYLFILNEFLTMYSPNLLFLLICFENLLVYEEKYTTCWQIVELYEILQLQYEEIFNELSFLKEIWEHFFFFEKLPFTHPKTFEFLYNNDFNGILQWFGAMSLFVYESELPSLTDESSASIMVDEIFGARLFQEENFEQWVKWNKWNLTKILDVSKITNLKNNFETLQNKVIVSRCYFFENEFFLKTFFIDLNIEYISNKNWYNNYYLVLNKNFLNLVFIQNNFYYFNTSLIIYLSLLFILINLSFKLTAAPFHFWAPSVYGGSPLPTITFLSIFSKLTVIFLISWLFLNIFDNLKDIWQFLIFCLAILSLIGSILGAFVEKIFKRFFIYSSTGHVGFMLIGISVLNIDGLKGTLDYLILYVISSFLIWFIIMHLSKKTTTLINLKGLSFNQTFLSFIFSIVIFSLSGIPPLGGFFVKYEIFYSLINSSFFFFAYFLLILTIISFFYYLRLIKIIFFENNEKFIKNKNLNDIKLRIISFLFFIIPFFILYIDNAFHYILKEILINSIY